jgi:hypothetical protein
MIGKQHAIVLDKIERWGICSRSESTSVEPSRAGSRWKCVLSKMMVTTCLMFPRGECKVHPTCELDAGAGLLAGFEVPGPAKEVGVTGYNEKTTATTEASTRCHPVLTIFPGTGTKAFFAPAR